MRCRECERVLLDGERCTGGSEGTLYRAHAHLANCPRCRNTFGGVADANAALELLRDASKSLEASDEIERDLLITFRERKELLLRGGQQRWHFSRWAVAAALVIVAGVVGYIGMHVKFVHPMSPTLSSASVSSPSNAKHPILNRLAKKKDRPMRLHTTPSKTAIIAKSVNVPHENKDVSEAIRPEPKREAVASSSAPPVPENEGGTILRVTVPASSLQMIGLPVLPETANRRVTADITLDPYGVVQRVDLVQPRPIRK
jgi:hypothetical protein